MVEQELEQERHQKSYATHSRLDGRPRAPTEHVRIEVATLFVEAKRRGEDLCAKDVAATIGRDKRTVYRIIKRLQSTPPDAEQEHREETRGRKRLLNDEHVDYAEAEIKRFEASGPGAKCNDLAAQIEAKFAIPVSESTILRRLHERNYECTVPRAKPILTANHKQRRIAWARKHKWSFWTTAVISDEKVFRLGTRNGRKWGKKGRMGGNRQPKAKFPAGIMAWGAVTHRGVLPLVWIDEKVNSDVYCNDILAQGFLQNVAEMLPGEEWYLQEDGATCHKSKFSQKQKEEYCIPLFLEGDWAPSSPDLSIIEQLWAYCETRLGELRGDDRPKTLAALRAAVDTIWNAIPQELVDELYASMPDRCQAVIDGGGETIDLRWWRRHVKRAAVECKSGKRGSPPSSPPKKRARKTFRAF